MKIVYWSDYACPYCYIAEQRLKRVIKDLDAEDKIEMEMKSFQLDPEAKNEYVGSTVVRFARKYGLPMELAEKQIEQISQLGRDEGIDFRYADTRFTNTMDAHRLTKYAQIKKGHKFAEKLIESLFDAYFTKNLELSDKKVLKACGTASGLTEEEIDCVLNSEDYRDEVILDEREAMRYGISAVPFFVVGTAFTMPGAQPYEMMKNALKKALDEENAEIKATGKGISCGPDGCRIR